MARILVADVFVGKFSFPLKWAIMLMVSQDYAMARGSGIEVLQKKK
jgi:hypothetical protein